jgi:hypothetical protein
MKTNLNRNLIFICYDSIIKQRKGGETKMWRSKKFLLAAVLAVVALIGSLGGVALAQSGDEGNNQPAAQHQAMLDKVCAIYEQNTGVAINSAELQKAFDQARSEMQDEALNNFFQGLVDEGKITQEQADQYKAWLKSKPDVAIPFAPGFSGRGMHRGFGGPNGEFPGWCKPEAPE